MESALTEHETYPLIIADPPWVPHRRIGDFPEDPPLAIDGGDDGLRLARACVRVIDDHLRPDGAALLQLGSSRQVEQLRMDLSSDGRNLAITQHRRFPGGELILLVRTH
jgi:methylase of polypeptide subunit release factors